MTEEKQVLFVGREVARAFARSAHEILEKAGDVNGLVLIGIRSRGVHLARRIARRIDELTKVAPPVGVLDVTPYRDDRAREPGGADARAIEMAVAVDGKTVVLID